MPLRGLYVSRFILVFDGPCILLLEHFYSEKLDMHPLAQPRVHQVSMDLPGMDSMMATKNVQWKVW